MGSAFTTKRDMAIGDGKEQHKAEESLDATRRQSLQVVELVRDMQSATAGDCPATACPAGTPLSRASPVSVANSRQLPESASRGPGYRSIMSTQAPGVVPPAICSTLVMKSAISYEVSMNRLRGLSTGSLDVLGMSGKKLLQFDVVGEKTDRTLALSCVRHEDDPRTTLRCQGSASSRWEVCGRRGVFYGLFISDCSRWNLEVEGETVMSVGLDFLEEGRLSAVNPDGESLAVAAEAEDHEGFWRIEVQPGVDSVLVTSCFLAVMTN